eukprot:TRINITY_DN56284_c0_g1_i1.p2 TRINITY_DN56284_c0_g1~~TRINITY_DN56284_c0_g1_i1.p2  ORF type:complete len:113 (-),score=43.43 TRINITY_DN56284_c0_g1_i1:18-356(-)
MQRGLVGSEMCIRDRTEEFAMVPGIMYVAPVQYFPVKEEKTDDNSHATETMSERVEEKPKSKFFKEYAGDEGMQYLKKKASKIYDCLLYTSDAADDTPCVALGGRRMLKKKK